MTEQNVSSPSETKEKLTWCGECRAMTHQPETFFHRLAERMAKLFVRIDDPTRHQQTLAAEFEIGVFFGIEHCRSCCYLEAPCTGHDGHEERARFNP